MTNKMVSFVLALVLWGMADSQVAFAFQDIDVSVVGLAITKEDPESEYGESMVPGLQAGTTVYVRVQLPKRTVIKITQSKDTPLSIKDSTGKTLPDSGSDFGFMSSISDDGKTVLVPVSANTVPAEGAKSITISGTVTLICGADPKTEEVAVEIASGKKVELAGIEFEISDIQDSFMLDDGQMFELQSKTSPSQIKSIKAILANGKRVEVSPSGSSEFGFGDDITFGRSYDVPCKVASIKKLEVTFFENVEEVNVPMDLSVELGF